MPFLAQAATFGSLSVVGMAKNTGKTETLNYLLERLRSMPQHTIAVTSIGIDGENTDQVTRTPKPEITLSEGTLFVTAESDYLHRRLVSEILDISNATTSLGRLVTARVLQRGKVQLSGPADTATLKEYIDFLPSFGINQTIVDGALSRLSLASPAITDAMILATGAALSANANRLIKQTLHVCSLINTPTLESQPLCTLLSPLNNGLWAIDEQNNPINLNIASTLLAANHTDQLFRYGNKFYTAGSVGDAFLNLIAANRKNQDCLLVVRDFTKLFLSPEVLQTFYKRGGKIRVLKQPRLIALTVNPTSPEGYRLDSDYLCQVLHEQLNLPVFDVRKLKAAAK